MLRLNSNLFAVTPDLGCRLFIVSDKQDEAGIENVFNQLKTAFNQQFSLCSPAMREKFNDSLSYYQQFNLASEQQRLNTWLTHPFLLTLLTQCRASATVIESENYRDYGVDAERIFALFIKFDANHLPLEVVLDFDRNERYSFNLQTHQQFAEEVKTTDLSYLQERELIQAAANQLAKDLKPAAQRERYVFLHQFNRRWANKVSATFKITPTFKESSAKKATLTDADVATATLELSVQDKLRLLCFEYVMPIQANFMHDFKESADARRQRLFAGMPEPKTQQPSVAANAASFFSGRLVVATALAALVVGATYLTLSQY